MEKHWSEQIGYSREEIQARYREFTDTQWKLLVEAVDSEIEDNDRERMEDPDVDSLDIDERLSYWVANLHEQEDDLSYLNNLLSMSKEELADFLAKKDK